MPSHIFTRVGYWNESIGSNIASARTAKDSKDFGEQLHASDYLVYAYLQLAQDVKARKVIDDMNTVTGVSPDVLPGNYSLAASPARFMVERGDWKGAADLQVPATKFLQVQALTHFARASGRPAPAIRTPGQSRHRQARRVARQAARGQGCLLGGAGRHPAAGRDRIPARCRGQA
jgi:hypothetical protein